MAGFKAGAACSAVFVAGRPAGALADAEFAGMFGEAKELPAPEIDRARRVVRVTYDGGDVPWPESDPGKESIAPRTGYVGLESVLSEAFDGESFGGGTQTIGVVVAREGRLVAERYREGFGPDVSYRTWSVAKTITGALIGILVGRGDLQLDGRARIGEWDEVRPARRDYASPPPEYEQRPAAGRNSELPDLLRRRRLDCRDYTPIARGRSGHPVALREPRHIAARPIDADRDGRR